MSSLDDATRTQIANIERRTGRSMDELVALVAASGLEKHGEIVAWLKTEQGHGPRRCQSRGPDRPTRAGRRPADGRPGRRDVRRPQGRPASIPRPGHRERPGVRG